MKKHTFIGLIIAGCCAGAVNGLFGAGGGMVLVPLLCFLTDFRDQNIFNASIVIILPICMISLLATALISSLPWQQSVPYLFGSAAGGLAAGLWGGKIPSLWLHKALGIMIIWGGIRYLC